MQKAGLKPISEGVSTGVSAMLLLRSKMDGAGQHKRHGGGAARDSRPRSRPRTAIVCLNKLMKLDIDISELDKEAKEVEAKIREIIDKHKESHESYKNAVGDSGPSMYA